MLCLPTLELPLIVKAYQLAETTKTVPLIHAVELHIIFKTVYTYTYIYKSQ